MIKETTYILKDTLNQLQECYYIAEFGSGYLSERACRNRHCNTAHREIGEVEVIWEEGQYNAWRNEHYYC